MSLKIPAEEMAQYRQTARRREAERRGRHEARRVQAWELAREAANLLRRHYGVERVAVFGSILSPDLFDDRSDVDLAAWGLTSVNWLRAIVAVQSLSREIELNLVDVDCCSPELRRVIERDGVMLWSPPSSPVSPHL